MEYAPSKKWHSRMEYLVPTYIVPRIESNWDIVSIGCGGGDDVELLRDHGLQAFGFDPVRHKFFDQRKESVRPFLRQGTAQDMPFGDKRFDYGYSLEVIEHVGCVDFKTTLGPDAEAERVDYLKACLLMIKPGGKLLVTTSNRLCLIDVGHPHKYHAFGRWLSRVFKPRFGISLPWHRENFLPSVNDIRRYAEKAIGEGRVEVRSVSIKDYPQIAGASSWKGALVRLMISVLDNKVLRTSPFCPLLNVEIVRIA
ncbi:MAG: class I SAM-dependent methyltransferase [Parvibaculum sp.]|nr:class I SAM-dependent methyltransferase [Parvibaculum sp.]